MKVIGALSKEHMDYFKSISGQTDAVILNRLACLSSLCKKLDKLNEIECNEGLTSKQEATEKELIVEATQLAGELGCKLYHQGDPRGPAIRLIRPDGRSNGMDGETWYLP